MHDDFDAPVLLPALEGRVAGNGIGLAPALGGQTRSIPDRAAEDVLCRLRARQGEVKV